jgi:hypothetical protein
MNVDKTKHTSKIQRSKSGKGKSLYPQCHLPERQQGQRRKKESTMRLYFIVFTLGHPRSGTSRRNHIPPDSKLFTVSHSPIDASLLPHTLHSAFLSATAPSRCDNPRYPQPCKTERVVQRCVTHTPFMQTQEQQHSASGKQRRKNTHRTCCTCSHTDSKHPSSTPR